MKKLFVSVPMKGRTEEEIKASIQKMKKIAEIYEGEELELIDSYIEDNPPKDNNEDVWYLGESLKKLAQADVFVGIDDVWDWSGCYIENEVAARYEIKKYSIPAEYAIENYNELVNKLNQVSCDRNIRNVKLKTCYKKSSHLNRWLDKRLMSTDNGRIQ